MAKKITENEYSYLWMGAKICCFNSIPKSQDILADFYKKYGWPKKSWKKFWKKIYY